MNKESLSHLLTEAERKHFEEQGYLYVPNALSSEMVEHLINAVDKLHSNALSTGRATQGNHWGFSNFLGEDDAFLELVDLPTTLPKVWGILGWNIKLYHSHLIVLPPLPSEEREKSKRLGWHQDSGRLNIELEGNPRPRVSLKVAFFLTDTSVPGRGNFSVIPGSHKWNALELPDENTADPENATSVFAKPGTAVFFDRRLWHAAGRNTSDIVRKVLFYGYSYRWLQPRDNMTVAHVIEHSDPIRQQILGKSTGGMGYTSPGEKDVPLRSWIQENLGSEAVAR